MKQIILIGLIRFQVKLHNFKKMVLEGSLYFQEQAMQDCTVRYNKLQSC